MAYFETCPSCGSDDTLGSRKRDKASCEDCGFSSGPGEALPESDTAPGSSGVAWPEGIDPENDPIYLLLPLGEYLKETHPRVKLHWLLDTLEVALRWVVALALAEIHASSGGKVPKGLRNELRSHVQRPTLGRWVAMVRALSAAAPGTATLVPTVFGLHDQHVADAFERQEDGGNEKTSLLVLRNLVAHSGGLSRDKAGSLLAHHEERFLGLVRAVLECTRGVDVCGLREGRVVRLCGMVPRALETPVPPGMESESTWLASGDIVVPLFPLTAFGRVRGADSAGKLVDRGNDHVPQVYARAGEHTLSYTPIGSDEAHSERPEVAGFREFFGLDEKEVANRRESESGFLWTDFLKEAHELAQERIGRKAEIDTISEWRKKRDPRDGEVARIGWITGGPGSGKSTVVAQVASNLAGGKHNGLYYHRFRGGDARNNRRSFLQLMQQALWEWKPLKAITEPPNPLELDGRQLEEDVHHRLSLVEGLVSANPKARDPLFLVIADGLDEVVSSDTDLKGLIKKLAVPGTLWLLAGRPDYGLDQEFTSEGCEPVFGSAGLPLMDERDIRAMLVAGLGNARYALFGRDSDDEDAGGSDIHNPFVEAVVERANGLPIYVHLLLEDLRAGVLNIRSEQSLPDGLDAYYDALIERMGMSDIKTDLTLLVCLLAVSEEPLDPQSMALLLSPDSDDPGPIAALEGAHIENVLRAGRALLRESVSANGNTGYILYHQSFREHVRGTKVLARSVKKAQRLLVRLASRWSDLPAGALQTHLFRWGTEYAIWWLGVPGAQQAWGRLRDFSYLQARTRTLPAFEMTDLADEYGQLLEEVSKAGEVDADLYTWKSFFREQVHFLRRGNDAWPTHKLLLQLATEHADDSPVTRAAESWLQSGACDWKWLRRADRRQAVRSNPCLAVLEGHEAPVLGACLLSDGLLLSWDQKGLMRTWDLTSGEAQNMLSGHTEEVLGVLVLEDSTVLSFSKDGTIRRWDPEKGEPLQSYQAHEAGVNGIRALHSGLLSWSEDGTARVWSLETGQVLQVLEGHEHAIEEAGVLSDGRVFTCAWDRTARLWNLETGACEWVLEGHDGIVRGALDVGNDTLVSWSDDMTLRTWNTATCKPGSVLEGHTAPVAEAHLLDPSTVLSWSDDGEIRLWDWARGECIRVVQAHDGGLVGVCVLSPDRFLSWADDGRVRCWSARAEEDPMELVGHTGRVQAVLPLGDKRLATVSWDTTMRIWDLEDGRQVATLRGHDEWVEGCCMGPNGQLVTWSFDNTVRTWDPSLEGDGEEVRGHTDYVKAVMALADGRLFSWSWDHTMRLWNPENGDPLGCWEAASPWVESARVLDNGNLVVDGAVLLVPPSTDSDLDLPPQAGAGEAGDAGPEEAPAPENWQVHSDTWLEASARNVCAVHLADDSPLQWHCDGALKAWTASTDGTFSITMSHRVLVLHLYLGGQRIDVT